MLGHTSLRAKSALRGTSLLDPLNLLAFLTVLALIGGSLLMQADAVFYKGGDSYERQTIWIVIGGTFFVLAAFVDLRLAERGAYFFYAVCVLLLILTLFIGTHTNRDNSTRWLSFGAMKLQPSEFAKLAVTLALARYLHNRKERSPGDSESRHSGKYDLRGLVKPLGLVLVPVPLILVQPDLGTALMILVIAGTMLAIEGIKRKAAIVLVLGTLVATPVAWKTGLIKDYQKDRVFKLIDQDWEKVNPDTGEVITRRLTQGELGMIAIGTGGLTGQGHRAANPVRMSKLPEVQTDFISAMIGEEFGFVGLLVALFLFWWLVMWSLRTALDARSRFCRLVCVGVGALFGWQVFVNIGMVSGILPVVGVPLPFLSYGGSATMAGLISLGLVFNIALKRGRL